MTAMPHLHRCTGTISTSLQASQPAGASTDGTPETTYYVYDAAGQRVRKVTERRVGRGRRRVTKDERIYLGGFEIYREYAGDGTAVTLERETLHVMDDKQRVALVETRTAGDDGSATRLIRYQSATTSARPAWSWTRSAEVISYEEYYPYGSTSYQASNGAVKAQRQALPLHRQGTGRGDGAGRSRRPVLRGVARAVDKLRPTGHRRRCEHVRLLPEQPARADRPVRKRRRKGSGGRASAADGDGAGALTADSDRAADPHQRNVSAAGRERSGLVSRTAAGIH